MPIASSQANPTSIQRLLTRPSRLAKAEDRTRFVKVCSFNRKDGEAGFLKAMARVREGDLIAYRMGKWEAWKKLLFESEIRAIGYAFLRYGHLSIVVNDVNGNGGLSLFSSETAYGTNLRTQLETIQRTDWDCWRLNQWDRVEKERFYEFMVISLDRSSNKSGYDYTGVMGLWNSNLKPDLPQVISNEYTCSTLVAAAFYYAGVELDSTRHSRIGDLVTPYQVVRSKGGIFPLSKGITEPIQRGVSERSAKKQVDEVMKLR